MPVQQVTWERLLRPVYGLVMDVLERQGIYDEDIGRTWFRWDMPDITFAWPKIKPSRMIHTWLMGEWPRYQLHFEGAAWKDEEEKLERKVIFYPLKLDFRLIKWIVAVGSAEEFFPEIVGPPELNSGVLDLVKSVVATTDYDLEKQPPYPLRPIPLSK